MIGPSLQEQIGKASPGQKLPVIIALKQQADNEALEKACAGKTKEERWAYVVSELKRLTETTQRDLLSFLASEERAGKVTKVNRFWIVNAAYCEATPEVIQEIASRNEVWFVDCDRVFAPNALDMHHSGEEPPRVNTVEWPMTKVGADSVWRLLGITGNNVVVGHIDTGCNYNHLDLAGHMWNSSAYPHHGWNFEQNNDDPMDTFGHGTFIAGNVSSDGTAGDTCGMAPRSRSMICRVRITADTIAENQIWSAMQFCLAPPLDSTNHAHLIVTSLGWLRSWNPRLALWRQNVTNVATAGLAFIASAGSEGPSAMTIRTPGDVPGPWHHPAEQNGGRGGSITIGCTDNSDNIASFCSQGPVTWDTVSPYRDYPYPPGLLKPDLCAPGVNVTSCNYSSNNGYTTMSGTSWSTGYVGGVVALMLEKNPSLLPWQVDSILQMTVRPLGTQPKNNTFGTGRVSAYQAVLHTPLPLPYPQFQLTVAGADTIPPSGTKVDSVTVTSMNNFNSPVTMTLDSIRPNTGTITVVFNPNPVTPPPNGSIRTGMQINTSGTPEGTYVLFYHGTGDTVTRRGQMALWVTGPTFLLTSTPRSRTVLWRDSTSYADTVVSISGFNSPCTLSATLSPPSPYITISFLPDSIVIPTGGRTMRVRIGGYATLGRYLVTVTARSGSIVRTLDDTLVVVYYVQGPDGYGYYAYDNTDTLFRQAPVYAWIELNPNRGGNGVSIGPGGDDVTFQHALTGIHVRHYGVHFDYSSICSNGWLAMGSTTSSVYTNYALPSNSFVPNGVAIFWDDLDLTTSGTWWYRRDANQRLVAEWDSVPRVSGIQAGSFEVIVYDTSLTPLTATTRDCEVVLQWKGVGDISSMTVGQQNAAMNVGLNCLYNGIYDPSMAPIVPGRALKFTTDPPRSVPAVDLSLLVNPALPMQFSLGSALPNPAKGSIAISYDLPVETGVSLKVYNLSGQLVRTLASGKEKAGYKHVTWDGRSEDGSRVASGVYFYRLEAGSFTATRKIVVIR
jgi:subtilisin family serine protease